MASKPSPDKLIHCDACGEDYSATYRRCPFCGARNDPRRAFRDSPPPAQDEDDQDDGYVFDGQDAFDDKPDDEEYYARPKAGKRLAPRQGGRGVDLPPVNWPRLITFLCSLVIIVAALIIVFTVIYPQLHGNNDPKPGVSQSQPPASMVPSASPSDAVTLPSEPVEPTDAPPVDTVPAGPAATGITLNSGDITIWVGEGAQLKATVAPADWTGTVTWTSSNPEWLTVSDTGYVTNVNTSGAYHNAYVTATADGVSAQCVVRVQSRKKDAAPVQSTTPSVSNPPAVTTTPPSGGNSGPTVGRQGTIVNAELGLRVRSGPGTGYEVVASLVNDNSVTVLADAGGGWYQISFAGSGGVTMVGYVMGDYISTN